VIRHAGPTVTVTVAIASVGRPAALRTALSYVAAQLDEPDEVMVIAQRQDLATQETASAAGARVVIVEKAGLAQAIETAVANATCDIVSFVDDDAEALPDWVQRIRETFAGDDALGVLGGRDNVHGDRDSGDESLLVGALRRGRFIGNHHLGKGTRRSAHHVKGANMSVRASPARNVPLAGLVTGGGAQSGNEVILSLGILSQGYSGAYDPRIQVDHHPAARASGDERTLYTRERTYIMRYNQAVAVALYRPRVVQLAFFLRGLALGDRICCGVALFVLMSIKGDTNARARMTGSLDGLVQGFRGARRFRRAERDRP
jgi:glycosyltransferase involved in cell wall biosynthesis